MCGIWCFFGNRRAEDRLVDVPHRGPDGRGVERFRHSEIEVELAHWRLSILDLSSRSDQPLAYRGGRYHVIFNGEIYNYRELRAELREAGYEFRSDGDTEVIPAAYDHWGKECLAHFRGMFAFCLWDREKGTLFAARDRFGIKPLYYFLSDRGVAFASEIKQFTGLHDFRAKANLTRVTEFLAYGAQDHSEETMWDGVRQLRGGQCVTLDTAEWQPTRGLPVRRWYELKPAEPFDGTFEEASEKYREIFSETVSLHLRSDVPVGSCLSGGMDSSAIVCAISGLLKGEGRGEIQNTFSCCFEDPDCDERPFMRAVEEYTGARAHHVFPKAEDALAALETMIWHQDEPVNNATVFSQFTLFQSVKAAGVKVMLDGQGGDEQLASYPQFFGPHLLGMLARGRFAGALHETRRFRELHGWTLADTAKSLLFWFGPAWLAGARRRLAPPERQRPWLAWDALETRGTTLGPPWGRQPGEAAPVTTEWLSRMMLTVTTLPMLLHWEDRNSMAHSIEARVPFLDHRLIEFTLSLPDEFKTKDGITKRILKSAMRATMPAKVIDRTDKKGFATPEERWLRADVQGKFRTLLLDAARENPGVLSPTGVETEFDLFIQGRKPFSNVFWRMITFGIWARKFGVQM
jgi:asparagine synthase (glutamine-hydrolysing)